VSRRTICVMGRVLDQDDGLGIYTSNLLHHVLAADTTSRYVILLRTPRHAHLFEKFSNTETLVIPARMKTLWDQVAVPIAARHVRADIIFNPKFSLPLISRRPGVFVLHGSDWYVNPRNYKWWDNIYIRLMIPVYCRKAKHLLAISQCVVNDLVRYAHIDSGKVTVTYAAPGAHFSPCTDRATLRNFAARYRLPERFILSVTRAYHTGHDRQPQYPGGNIESLLFGYQRYRLTGGNLPLIIIGKDIDKYLRGRGFSDGALTGIQFAGFIPHEEMVMAYNSAEFFVLTTLYESFALPLVEAMASGCPAIVPTTGACPEVSGGAARLVNPRDSAAIGDAMAELASSSDLREEMRQAGLERAREFTWTDTAEHTLAVFDAIAPRSLPVN
jgi:glycosyltransferase involved in cell wall biosynthesis